MPYQKHKQYRLPRYNYSNVGDYFITICTKGRIPHFGTIIQTKEIALMELTAIGTFVRQAICSIPVTYKNTRVGATIIMPNHVHLIITILSGDAIAPPVQSTTQQLLSPQKGLAPLVPGSVSAIINHLKGNVTKQCRINGFPDFAWQPRFYDHIIRNAAAYDCISNYIANNVYHWHKDENNPQGENFRQEIRR